jgi:organic hydroperoxide reductase OsmC/OhrA
MSEHRATIAWSRGNAEFTYETYPRDHIWRFDGVEVIASAAPDFKGNGERVDPEEGFVAAVSSCHMLTFLAVAARKRIVVDAYEDDAVGHLEKNEKGKLAVTRVELRPRIRFGGAPPSAEEIARLHELAHENCFIAQSVLTEITVSARD